MNSEKSKCPDIASPEYLAIRAALGGDDHATHLAILRHRGSGLPYVETARCLLNTEQYECDDEGRAVWTRKYMDSLPDSHFLYVEPGGTKDKDGKTVPRTHRHFPYKDASGKIDQAHLKNALARIPQSNLSKEIKAKVFAHAQKLYNDTFSKKSDRLDDLERRVLTAEDVELRLIPVGGQLRLTGYAAKYEKWSQDLGGFREKIRAGAFEAALKTEDVRCLKNHNPDLLLGRTASGTMKLTSDTVGLRFETDLPDTVLGRDTATEIKRGDLSGCSFAFRAKTDEWNYLPDGKAERTIIDVQHLYDVGPVTYPAYPDTSVAVRAMEEKRAEALLTAVEPPPAEPKQPIIAAPARDMLRERLYRKAGRIISRNRPSADA